MSTENDQYMQKKALLLWRRQEISVETMQKIENHEIACLFNPFVKLTILQKGIKLDYYREKFTKKTKKQWKNATINDIFKANLVWG